MGKTPHGVFPAFPLNSGIMKEDNISLAEPTFSAPVQTPPTPTHRILVADDDIHILRLNVKLLSDSGYQVDAVEDGAAAWEAMNAVHYDLLLTDNNMPKLTGIELIQKMHSVRMTLPVIMITGISQEEDLVRNPWLKTIAILLKPYSIDELLRVVNRTLSSEIATRYQMQSLHSERS